MFTGLVEELGTIRSIHKGQKSVRLSVNAQVVVSDVKLGDSIAVNGTCLTVVEFGAGWFAADVMPETVKKTVLASLKPGDRVNLERTLTLQTRLGGHMVSGHIDGVGEIMAKEKNDIAIIFRIGAAPAVLRYIVKQGSVAVDGISLTVVDFTDSWFSVSIIPHTAAMTTLGYKEVGQPVNVEADIIGKYVEKFMGLTADKPAAAPSALTRDFLLQNGF